MYRKVIMYENIEILDVTFLTDAKDLVKVEYNDQYGKKIETAVPVEEDLLFKQVLNAGWNLETIDSNTLEKSEELFSISKKIAEWNAERSFTITELEQKIRKELEEEYAKKEQEYAKKEQEFKQKLINDNLTTDDLVRTGIVFEEPKLSMDFFLRDFSVEELFKIKLEIFEKEEVQECENRELRSIIRKSDNLLEILHAYHQITKEAPTVIE